MAILCNELSYRPNPAIDWDLWRLRIANTRALRATQQKLDTWKANYAEIVSRRETCAAKKQAEKFTKTLLNFLSKLKDDQLASLSHEQRQALTSLAGHGSRLTSKEVNGYCDPEAANRGQYANPYITLKYRTNREGNQPAEQSLVVLWGIKEKSPLGFGVVKRDGIGTCNYRIAPQSDGIEIRYFDIPANYSKIASMPGGNRGEQYNIYAPTTAEAELSEL